MLKTVLISMAAMAVIPFASAGPAHHAKPVKQQVIIVPAKAVKAGPIVVVRIPALATVKTVQHRNVNATRSAVAYRQANRAAIRQTGLSLRQLDRIEDRIDTRQGHRR
jgi:hypothetical protein